MTKGSNSASRADMIKDAVRKIADLETQRKALGADIRAIEQSIVKGGLDIKIADFTAAVVAAPQVVPDEESDDAGFVSDDPWDEVQVQAG